MQSFNLTQHSYGVNEEHVCEKVLFHAPNVSRSFLLRIIVTSECSWKMLPLTIWTEIVKDRGSELGMEISFLDK